MMHPDKIRCNWIFKSTKLNIPQYIKYVNGFIAGKTPISQDTDQRTGPARQFVLCDLPWCISQMENIVRFHFNPVMFSNAIGQMSRTRCVIQCPLSVVMRLLSCHLLMDVSNHRQCGWQRFSHIQMTAVPQFLDVSCFFRLSVIEVVVVSAFKSSAYVKQLDETVI